MEMHVRTEMVDGDLVLEMVMEVTGAATFESFGAYTDIVICESLVNTEHIKSDGWYGWTEMVMVLEIVMKMVLFLFIVSTNSYCMLDLVFLMKLVWHIFVLKCDVSMFISIISGAGQCEFSCLFVFVNVQIRAETTGHPLEADVKLAQQTVGTKTTSTFHRHNTRCVMQI